MILALSKMGKKEKMKEINLDYVKSYKNMGNN